MLGAEMKLIICMMIVFVSGYLGINIKNQIHAKYLLFVEINAFLHYFLVKIAFFKEVYVDCLKNYIESNNPKYKRFFSNIIDLINNNSLTQKSISDCTKSFNLSQEEQSQIYHIFANIGKTDLANQKKIIEANIALTEQKINYLEQQKKAKGEVSAKLGICIGLVLCILIY